MNSRTVQEVRLILWPWCLMTLAGLVPLIKLLAPDMKSDWPIGVAVFGFFGGAAIATGLSFRNALQICPAALLQANSVSRRKVWLEKMIILMAAAVCAGLIVCSVQTLSGNLVWHELHANAFEPVLLLVIIVCSMGYWTLLTRSVVGGILLTVVAQFVLYLLLFLFATSIDRMSPANPGETRLSHEPEVHAALSWFVAGVGLSYAAAMLWLGRRRFAGLELRNDSSNHDRLKSFIRKFSSVTEFCLVLFISFGLTLIVTSTWIIRHLSHAPPAPYDSVMHLRNDGVIVSVVIELLTLGMVLWLGRIRGWSLATFGLRFSWKSTGAGVLLFFGFLLIQQVVGLLTTGVFHRTVDFHRVSHLTIPFITLLSVVNPVFEEAIESGYIFHALQRHGMWITVLVAAAFRGYLHATMGVSGFITMFAMGLLYGIVYWKWRQLWPLIIAHALQMFYALLPQTLAT